MKRDFKLLTLIFALLSALQGFAQTPAFPTAEGFGKYATGGRGGKVVEVTNLKDYYESTEAPIHGSFRWAVKQYPGQPLTVVFRVSGIIALKSDVVNYQDLNELRIDRDSLTIAGQTAPGDGICIRGGRVNFGGCQNLVVRYMRFRVGLSDGNTGDFIPGGAIDFENGQYAIFDHCTFGWSAEENVTLYDDHYVTVQWCILHEGLYTAGHEKGERSYACQWAGSPATMWHNLLADNVSRSCRFNGSSNVYGDRHVLMDYVNNVNYNWGKVNSCYGGEREAGKLSTHEVNFVGNYYKPGPATPTPASKNYFFEQSAARSGYTLTGPSYWYVSGNVMEGDSVGTADNWLRVHNNSPFPLDSLKHATPFVIPEEYKIPYTSAEEAYNAVLDSAGAFPRDSVDRRIIYGVRTGTASGKGTVERYPSAISDTDTTWTYNRYYNKVEGIIDQPAGAGGYPEYKTYNQIVDKDSDGMADSWEVAHGLNPNDPSDRNWVTAGGYTALEVYMNSLVGEYINPVFYSDVKATTVQKVKIYPTEVQNTLTIQSDDPLLSATIYPLSGDEVKTYSLSGDKTLNLSSLQQGDYVVRVLKSDNKVVNFKFIKE